MKIDRIEISFLEGSLEKPFGWSQRWTTTRSVIVLKVVTNNGIIGWRETYGSSASIPVMTPIAKMVIGENPNHLGKIWNKLYHFFYPGHQGTPADSLFSKTA